MHKFFLQFAALSGALAVCLGAFGAHALKDKLAESGLTGTYETAVSYHFYHTLALLAIGLLAMKFPSGMIHTSGYTMIAGLVVFSGSLYVLSLTGIRWLGAITPIGGLAFIVGWVCLFIAVYRAAL